MRFWCGLIAAAVAAPMTYGGDASTCPAPLAQATKLILVVTPSVDAPDATLATFERSSASTPWRARTDAEPAVVGKKGLGWGFPFRELAANGEPIKAEGDKRSPAGFYRLGQTFGFDANDRPNHLRLESGVHVCVDDLRSPHYNQIVSRAEAGAETSAENMREIPLYRHGIVVDYPTDRAAKAGSCIFVHIWRGAGQGTAGCVALPEASVAWLQDWARAGDAVIALLPETARERFGDCLPAK